MSDQQQVQITRLQNEIQRREGELVRLQTEISELERDLTEFQSRYDRIVGAAKLRLDAVKAAIEELQDQRRLNRIGSYDPQPEWTPPPGYIPVEEQYRRFWQVPASETPAPLRKSEKNTSLKQLYRDLVRRFHPDLAIDPVERARRTEIMSHINEAYAAQDADTLEALARQTELANDVPLVSLTVRHLQKTLDGLIDEIENLKRERDTLFYGEMMRLKLDEKLARMRGRDLLREIVQEMNAEYFQLLAKLDELKSQN